MLKYITTIALTGFSFVLLSQGNERQLTTIKDISDIEPTAIDAPIECGDEKTKRYQRRVWYPGKTGSEAQECAEAYIDSTQNSPELKESLKLLFTCETCGDGDEAEECEQDVEVIDMSIGTIGSAGGVPFRFIKVKYLAKCKECPEDKVRLRSLTTTTGVFPNPASDYLNINLAVTSKSGKVNLRLVDISGRVIINVTDNLQDGVLYSGIDVSSLVPGMYVLQASTDGKVIHTEKIQVTK